MTNARLARASGSLSGLVSFVVIAVTMFAAGSTALVHASFTGTGMSAEAAAPEKYSPDAELRQKLGKKAPTPNPYLSFLPVESRPDYALWRQRLTEAARMAAARKQTTQKTSSSSLAFAVVGETEPVGTRGVNDTQGTAQHLPGFGTGDGDDGAADVSGNMKTPAPTPFSPLPEDEGDIGKASATGLSGDGAKTASATIGDGPFGNAPITQVNISSVEDDGDITRTNVTGLDPGEFVSALADIGDGPFGSSTPTRSGDFDVYSFVVTPPQVVNIEVNRQAGETVFDPILAVADSTGTILFINDDRFPTVESGLDITFSCQGDPPCGSPTYYVFVGGYSGGVTGTGSFPSDTSDSATGPGAGSEGAYELLIAMPQFASGDFDFYSVNAVAGDRLEVEVDTSNFGGALDPIAAIYDSAGNMLALNDDDPRPRASGLDSYISLQAPETDTYFIAVGGFNPYVFPTSPASFLANPFDSSTGPGPGLSKEGDYDIIVSRNDVDLDYYSFDLEAGDVLGVNVNGGAPIVAFFAENEDLLVATEFGDALGNLPPSSPLPRGGDASMAYVASEPGTYAVAVGFGQGAYDLELRAFRPPQEATGTRQRIFIDFDGASVDTSIWGVGGTQPRVLSPLSSFLAGWGLAPGDEDAVIDGILVATEQNLKSDIRLTGNNPTFDIEILNSRDHADPFGEPDVSRVVIGGTTNESGLNTVGIAQSVDVGNYALNENSLVLLDRLSAPAGDPNSLNSVALSGGATIIDLIGVGVGNIAAHEAGHFFANFHTDNFNSVSSLMDTGGGGSMPGMLGLGPDLTFGTADDIDVKFAVDAYEPTESFEGMEDTKNAIAFGLTTGEPSVPLLLRRNDNGRWFRYALNDSTIAASDSVALTSNLTWNVESVSDFDGDGKDDVLIRRQDNGRWYMYLMDGAVVVDSANLNIATSLDWTLVAVADFNGDGTSDLLIRNQANGRWRMYLMDGLTILQTELVDLPGELVWDVVASGHFDLDGLGDVLLRRSDNGRWRMYRFDGLAVVETALVGLAENLVWQFQRAADFNGDGRLDVLVRRTDYGLWRLYFMDGTSVLGTDLVDLATNPDWQVESAADFDMDGRADALLRNAANGVWRLYLLDATTVNATDVLSIPTNSTIVLQAVADLDFDGDKDVLVRNVNTGRWFVYRLDGTIVESSDNVDMTNNLVWDLMAPELQ